MIPQGLEVLGKLTVPVGNVGSVEKVIVADILDGPGRESVAGRVVDFGAADRWRPAFMIW
jgi:hypothetical protein